MQARVAAFRLAAAVVAAGIIVVAFLLEPGSRSVSSPRGVEPLPGDCVMTTSINVAGGAETPEDALEFGAPDHPAVERHALAPGLVVFSSRVDGRLDAVYRVHLAGGGWSLNQIERAGPCPQQRGLTPRPGGKVTGSSR